MDEALILGGLAFALGGLLKGAIGAGTPVIVIPILSLHFGVPFAVSVFAIPAVLSNLWQLWTYRADLVTPRFLLPLTAATVVGSLAGSVVLANLRADVLSLVVAGMALAYVGFRLARPGWRLPMATAQRVTVPVGLVSGLLQGASGISAPISLTFINALGLERRAFIATVSVFFLSMTVGQVPALTLLGVLTPERAWLSLLACIPLFAAMPLGARIARQVPRAVFDKLVLCLLAVVALRLIWAAISG